jgi:hypothetical protein
MKLALTYISHSSTPYPVRERILEHPFFRQQDSLERNMFMQIIIVKRMQKGTK